VFGVVQGVGFRPFVHRLATELGLNGWVANDGSGVLLEVSGPTDLLDEFVRRLETSPPPLAVVESVVVEPVVESVAVEEFDASSELHTDGSVRPGSLQDESVPNRSNQAGPVQTGPIQSGFVIRSSSTSAEPTTLVPADVRPCDACLEELLDPADRRYRHALINCTDCGPRFTIIRALPYDRANTTMSDFAMCLECSAEYNDSNSRRFHAEPVSCRACGPRLRFDWASTKSQGDSVSSGSVEGAFFDVDVSIRFASAVGGTFDNEMIAFDSVDLPSVHPDDQAIVQTVAAIRAGLIVAIKGIGGYALVVDAGNDSAVQTLRLRKHRDEKPFAIQIASIEQGRTVVELNYEEEQALLGPQGPIILARSVTSNSSLVSALVAPGCDTLGVMLPSSGLHHLLAAYFEGPLVVTSGNVSDEPIVINEHQARSRLSGIADAFLSHDREIHRRADDSIVRRFGSTFTVLRRARGFVPNPVGLPRSIDEGIDVLGVGAELKNTVCIARGKYAFLSTHLGDLEQVEAFRSFRETIADLQQFLAVRPSLVVHDLHPEYLSSKWALDQEVETLAVQHHHAHIASCLAENGLDEPVLGLAFDGHGYGPDGTLWGGEFLVADLVGYERVGHFASVALPGASTAIRDPWRMAVSYLTAAYDANVPNDLAVLVRNGDQWADVERVTSLPSTILTSSVGRLFDAVAAILGVCDRCSFEGQAAMALEQRAWFAQRSMTSRGSIGSVSGSHPWFEAPRLQPIDLVEVDGTIRLHPFAFIRSIAEIVGASGTKVDVNKLAWLSHRLIADASVRAAEMLCGPRNIGTVALSGGVFQNGLLLGMIRVDLEASGVRVVTHRTAPPNDGGISLGQVAIGRAHTQRY
jgi:hydrogenase maturation protein HypF